MVPSGENEDIIRYTSPNKHESNQETLLLDNSQVLM